MRPQPAAQEGIALLLVLWVLTLLSVIAGQFCHAMRTEVNITRNFKESTQAYYIARAGLNLTLTELIRNQLFPRAAGDVQGEQADEDGDEEENEWRVNAVNPEVDFGDGRFSIWLENDSGKIDLNTADRGMLLMMLNGFDLDETEKETIVDSILDWRDADDLHRLNGAESDYYSHLPDGYECKDAAFDSIEELMLVKGVTPEIFNGGLEEMVTVRPTDSGRHPRGGIPSQSGTGTPGKTAVLPQGAGTARININAAPRMVLLALPLMTEELVDDIEEFRREKDFKSLTEVQEVVGPEVFGAISPFIGLELSPFFVVHASGMTEGGNARRTVRAQVEISARYDNRYRIVQWVDI